LPLQLLDRSRAAGRIEHDPRFDSAQPGDVLVAQLQVLFLVERSAQPRGQIRIHPFVGVGDGRGDRRRHERNLESRRQRARGERCRDSEPEPFFRTHRVLLI
jgi:hypothetical protein